MAELTPGQQDALRDLEVLQNASEYSIEFMRQRTGEKGTLCVEVSIECQGFSHQAPGLRLRDRERFWFVIDREFPLTPPTVFAANRRFAFNDHVYWAAEFGVWLCLYYSTEHQWQPSQGITGFLWRLLTWLKLASIGQLDAPGQPRHPPIAGGQPDEKFFVARMDCPPCDQVWAGFAVLQKCGSNRFDIVDWTQDVRRHTVDILAPAILINQSFVSQFPDYVSSLMLLLKSARIDERVLAVRLLMHIKNTRGRPPIYLVLGLAMRGPQGGASDQHLFIWKIPTRTANDLRNLCKKYKRVNEKTLEYLLEKGEGIVADLNRSSERLIHCRVYDQRPTVSRRRDLGTPLANLTGKAVTLWGVGGLGSYLAEALVRSGIKKLCLVDNGRVNPGLLVRQNYVDKDIGERKVDALCNRLREIDPAVELEPIAANLLRNCRKVAQSLADTDLLIDATASRRVAVVIDRYLMAEGPQDFPIASVGNDVDAKRALIAFTPSGRRLGPTDLFHRSFLELCDRNETCWLDSFWPRSTEEDWFEPEPGCSSPTYHGSGAQTASIAGSMLTETARLTTEGALPSVIGISPFFAEDSDIRFEFEDQVPGVCPVTDNEVRFLSSATSAIEKVVATSAQDKETGGVLFGFRDSYLNVVWVVAATGPTADSEATSTSFVCGVEGIAHLSQVWCEKTHGLVGFIGTWHSHPVSSATPSVTDFTAMKELLRQSGSAMHRLLLIIVGYSATNPQFGTYLFHDDGTTDEGSVA